MKLSKFKDKNKETCVNFSFTHSCW